MLFFKCLFIFSRQVSGEEPMITLLRRNPKGSLDTPMRWVLGGRWVAGKTTRQVQPVAMRPPGIENELLECPLE